MKHATRIVGLLLAGLVLGGSLLFAQAVSAQQPVPPPVDESVGVEGRISSPPPTQPATIVAPAGGQVFSALPITVTGSCPNDTMVKVFSNDVFVGSTPCNNGSYSLLVSLFSGRNDIISRVFDSLDQAGPDSPTITVFYNDPQFAQFGTQVLLTSQFARRAADPNIAMEWPIIVSSGAGPYAISADWGDGTPVELLSQSFAGVINLRHTYREPGVYKVIFKVADRNGSSAFLQVIAIVNGPGGTNRTIDNSGKETIVTKTRVLWEPSMLLLVLCAVTFWLGRRYELAALRKRIEREYR